MKINFIKYDFYDNVVQVKRNKDDVEIYKLVGGIQEKVATIEVNRILNIEMESNDVVIISPLGGNR